MWQKPAFEATPWPVAPRPFPEEAMGSWLGRVAARYRMSVDQLCDDHQLELKSDTSGAGWLVQRPLPDTTIGRLAYLARLDEQQLQEIQTPAAWAVAKRGEAYCAHCLFVNPVDVTSPRWKRAWLHPETRHCEVHGTPLATIACGVLRQCQNFDKTIKAVGRLEFERARNADK
jgi:hypothetical protein